MPYIKQDDRSTIRRRAIALADAIDDVGELNFAITTVIDRLFIANSPWSFNYASLNSILGVLEAVKLELHRRVSAHYEDLKKDANGDVYQWLLTEMNR